MISNMLKVFQEYGINWEGIGITVAAFFSVISGLFAIFKIFQEQRNKKRESGLAYITNSRIQWINEVRNSVAEFVEVIRPLYFSMLCLDDRVSDVEMEKEHKKLADSITPDLKGEIANKATKVILLMNFSDILDSEIIKRTDKIQNDIFSSNFQFIVSDQEVLLAYIKIYLKLEWNRVKYEAVKKYTSDLRKQELVNLCEQMLKDVENACVGTALKDLINYYKKD